MKTHRNLMLAAGIVLSFFIALTCYAAYHSHHTDYDDSGNFLSVYPQAAGTKLDSCALCHSGGSYVSNGKTTTLGSCQWCHYKTNLGADATQYVNTLNLYGLDYLNNGRNTAALTAIQDFDSDKDSYSNKVEIAALRYPGDFSDDPSKVAAPSKVFTRQQIEAMPQHKQFLFMNVTKNTSGDYYTEYSGVTMEKLLKNARMLSTATQIMVYSPDGFSYTFPLLPPANQDPIAGLQYYVNGPYPQGFFYYDPQADMQINTASGWCDYSALSCLTHEKNKLIADDLRLLMAIKREGQYLTPGVLNAQNTLDGEGPFRVVPPQVIPGPPDQASTSVYQNVIWPYQKTNDHNAGASSRSVTMIKVNPLPPGTTDINTLEAGWPYIDEDKIVVYGAINPTENIIDQLAKLISDVGALSKKEFQIPLEKPELEWKLEMARWLVAIGLHDCAYRELEQVIQKMDGCTKSTRPDRSDWLKNCDTQKNLYYAVNGVMVFLKILD